ncbi:MAG: ABC transporter permease [Nitrososphaerales archaeon]
MDFIKRRILIYATLFLLTVNLIFILPRFVPSSNVIFSTLPAGLPAGLPAIFFQMQSGLCLDQPIYVQYGCFLKNTFATWPPFFGPSYQYFPVPASNVVLDAFPWTILLVIPSLLVSIGIAYAVGWVSVKKGSKLSLMKYLGSTSPVVPPFWIGMVMIWAFAVSLHLFPAYGNYDTPTTGFNMNYFVASALLHYILPFATLVIAVFGQVFRPFKTAFERVSETEYASRVRGLRSNVVMSRYILRNALLGLLSSSAMIIGALISSDILVETVFNYRGIGGILYGAFINRDYPVMEASFFFLMILVIAISLCLDLVRLKLDPRLRHGVEEDENERDPHIMPVEMAAPTLQGSVSVSQVSIEGAFRILETSLGESFADLLPGYTWKEVLARLKATGIDADWAAIEIMLKKYEEFRYGGMGLQDVDVQLVVQLANSLPRNK